MMYEDYLDSLEGDLRAKKDRTDELDELFQLSFLGDGATVERVSWCVAKMAQNKVPDMRIVDIMVSLRDNVNPQVRENVAWGIGEIAGAGIGDDRCIDTLLTMMTDDNDGVRGMAAWAAGRLRRKLGMDSPDLEGRIRSLINDDSEYVRRSAEYALEGLPPKNG